MISGAPASSSQPASCLPQWMDGRTSRPADAMDSAWKSLVNNPAKLDAAVDAMASCMAKVLSLKDAAIDGNPHTLAGGRQTFGQVLYEEKEYFPTRDQLDQIDDIHKALTFVKEAHAVAVRVCTDADTQPNVVLSHYATKACFNQSWPFTRPRPCSAPGHGGEVTNETKLVVGGLKRSIFNALEDMVYDWLLECDEAMMIAFSDMPKGQSVDESPLYSLARDLAESISRRVSMFEPNRNQDDEDLSTRTLEERASEEVARTAEQAEANQRQDLVALRTLETLAQHGPNSEKGKAILKDRLDKLKYVVDKPPVELGLTGNNAARMSLHLLKRGCEPGLDPEVRSGIVRQWYMRHGGYAATAAAQAIQKIRCSVPQQPFINVIQPLGERAALARVQKMELPVMPFVREPRRWHFVQQQDRRIALDWLGRRVVRMTSLVVQLLAQGSLERGVVASTIVSPIATQAVLEARVVYGLLGVKLNSYAIGTKLLRFCEDVADVESHLSNSIDESMLTLCRFSTVELLSIFSPQSPALRVIMDEFTTRTRENLTFQMPVQYTAFAYDTLAILLPAIRARRERAGVGITHTSTPIQHLLRKLPQVRTWSPLRGQLQLELEDLKGQPRMLSELLKEFARRRTLVQYKRPYLGKQKHSPKMAFVFDSAQLVEALSGFPIRPSAAAAGVRAGGHGERGGLV